jgi:hypothetical protein
MPRSARNILLKGKGTQDRKSRSTITGRTKERVYSGARWLALLGILAFLSVVCFFCYSVQWIDSWRRLYYWLRRCWLYVLQRCGCSKVQTSYTLAKDVGDMV